MEISVKAGASFRDMGVSFEDAFKYIVAAVVRDSPEMLPALLRLAGVSDAQVDAIERRLQYAIGRFASRIRVARVTLTDLDGPNDATDFLCRLKVTLKKDGVVIVGDTDVSVEAAVANVADRCARSIARLLDRQRN